MINLGNGKGAREERTNEVQITEWRQSASSRIYPLVEQKQVRAALLQKSQTHANCGTLSDTPPIFDSGLREKTRKWEREKPNL